jgi:bifunctional pyridoxal-dependent enzyme with beta-cystathionase and maltose regulon repressor activities
MPGPSTFHPPDTTLSTVYTPFFAISHTKFRQFTHRPLLKRQSEQWLIDGYPQRNTLFNTSI